MATPLTPLIFRTAQDLHFTAGRRHCRETIGEIFPMPRISLEVQSFVPWFHAVVPQVRVDAATHLHIRRGPPAKMTHHARVR
eukprot:7662857-Pyramimonas_sp.AAC.1